MRLDPQAAAVLERLARSNTPSYAVLGVEAARELYRATRITLGPPRLEQAHTAEYVVANANGGIPLRMYRPATSREGDVLAAVIYFHGGGWVLGDLDTHDDVCRALCNLARCAVISVDYRLAPEHKFPSAVEDAIEAMQWVVREAQTLKIDAARLAVAGDSAGANLAAVAALHARDNDGPTLAMQALIYPSTDMVDGKESHTLYAENYGLTRDNILWFRDNYLARAEDAYDWRASPLRAPDLSRLPQTYLLTAGFDPLRDEGRLYAERLHEAGVTVTYECFEGMIHGFLTMGGVIAAARHAVYRVAQALRPALGVAPPGVRL